ncbi:MAG TPA: hypothetical protein VGS79_28010 [Puia sp.]|nr:hypothetical protein [Puia sp.]
MRQAGKIIRSILYAGILLASCNKTAFNPQTFPVHPTPAADTLHNLRHMIDSIPSSDLFLLALQRTGYDSLLSATGTFYTLVVPTDSLLIASGYTKDVITYLSPSLLVSGIIVNQIWNGQFSDSVLDGAQGYIKAAALTDPANQQFNTYSVAKQGGPTGGLWINGVQVSYEKAGTWASNGYIFASNAFYTPPVSNAWTVLQTRPEFSYFVAACRLDDSVVGAVGQLYQQYLNLAADSTIFLNIQNGYGFPVDGYTYFVPTNQAFINAGFKTIDDIRQYALTYTFDPGGYTLSPLDSLLYTHWIPNANLYYFDLLKDPNLNQRDAADLKLTMETELYNLSYYLNTGVDYFQNPLPTNGLEYPYKGILNFLVSGTTVSITCNSSKNPPAATLVEPDILCTNSVILHGVDHLFWPY